MIKSRGCPGRLTVTAFTGNREIGCFMIWISSRVIVSCMATYACFRGSTIIYSFVAGCTIISYRGMSAR